MARAHGGTCSAKLFRHPGPGGGHFAPVPDLASAIQRLESERDGEIEVAGPSLARSLTELGLIDEYPIDLHPVVLGRGTYEGPNVYHAR